MGITTRKPPSNIWLILFLLAGLFLWHRTSFPLWMLDVFPNQWGASCLHSGRTADLYTPLDECKAWAARVDGEARRLGLDCDLAPYMYPPFVAATLTPLAGQPGIAWRNAQFALNFLLLFVIAGIIAKLCSSHLTWRGFLWALVLVLVSYQMSRATKLGQLVPFLAALAWIGLLLVRSGRDLPGGLLIGVVSAVKIFPAVLMALLFLDRRYKAAWAAMGAVLVAYASSLLLLGIPIHEQWWQPMHDFAGKVVPFFGNQSLLGWLARAGLGYSVFDEMPIGTPWLSAAQWTLTLVFAALVLRFLWPLRGSLVRDHLPLSVGLGMGALLLVIPVSWEHYGLFVLPAAGWAVYRAWTDRDAKFWEFWLAAAVFFFTMKLTHFYYGDSILSRLVSGSQALGLLMLCVCFVRRISSRQLAALSPGGNL
jgi:hypothetical protein